jgi:DmsE family decaheme c-type cytochrome
MRRYLLVGFVCALLLTCVRSGWSAEAGAPKPGPATYVGTEVCKACHAPAFEKFSHTMMGKIFLFNARNEAERQACENCHGPGSNHVAAGGGKGIGGMITFRKDSGESADVQNQPCLACHERGSQSYWRASAHSGRGLSCVNCHTLMEKTSGKQMAKLTDVTPFGINRAEIEVCGQCHLQRKAQLMRSSHMPMREGKIVCSDCHNPHGTPNPALLRQTSVNENCYTCHTERRGPFLWEHPPVLESCTNCHEPHGSVNDRLLKQTDPRLCTQCHIATRHPGTPRPLKQLNPPFGGLASPVGPSVFAFNRSCTNCHSQVHGSNHPAGIRFTR